MKHVQNRGNVKKFERTPVPSFSSNVFEFSDTFLHVR